MGFFSRLKMGEKVLAQWSQLTRHFFIKSFTYRSFNRWLSTAIAIIVHIFIRISFNKGASGKRSGYNAAMICHLYKQKPSKAKYDYEVPALWIGHFYDVAFYGFLWNKKPQNQNRYKNIKGIHHVQWQKQSKGLKKERGGKNHEC